MEFYVNITTDNVAFDDNAEIPRILRLIADRLEANDEIAGTVNDINGNRVGQFGFDDNDR